MDYNDIVAVYGFSGWFEKDIDWSTIIDSKLMSEALGSVAFDTPTESRKKLKIKCHITIEDDYDEDPSPWFQGVWFI